MTAPDPRRANDLARIHMAKKALGLEDDTYRSLLKATTGKDSASALGPGERWKVLCELGRLGASGCPQPRTPPATAKPQPQGHPGKPTIIRADCQRLVGKIEAQLAEAKRPWAYAHTLAKRMFQKDQVQLCEPDELRRLVAALSYDAKRHGRPEG